MSVADALAQTLAAQRAAFMAELPVPAAVRRDRLARAAALVRDHADRFCDALAEDFGQRSRDLSMAVDISTSVSAATKASRSLGRWMKREPRRPQFPLGLLGARAWVEYQPKGVVGIIAPWNFPVGLVMGPLAGALAAGNRAMVKLSEYAPTVAALFEDVAPRYFAADEVAFVSGDAAVGQAFAGLPFDHLLFTGATGVGRHILHAAADNLVPVTLELGGKSPVIIAADADLPQAAERIALGKMMNAGQVCLAPDHVLAPAGQVDEVAEAIAAAAAAMYPTLLGNPDYTAIVNDRHHARLAALVDDARAKGARIDLVDPAGEDFVGHNGRIMPLHIVRGATDAMAVMREEIFGPILPIVGYRDTDDAIAQVNRRGRPLALYHFGRDGTERRRVLDRTVSGGASLDEVIFHISMADLPFGGIGPSGMGSYHGIDGFRTFSHAKAVFRQSRLDIGKLTGLKPPYGATLRGSIRRAMKK